MISGPDLACGGTASVASMIVVMTMVRHNFSTPAMLAGMIIALLAGTCIGAIEGILSYSLKAPSFLITLACQYVVFGLAEIGLQGKIWSCTQNEIFNAIGTKRVLNLPMPVYFFLIIAVIAWFLANRTVYGRQVYAVGGNPRTSKLIGISVRKIMISSFAISGFTAALAGILLATMTQQGTPAAGVGYEGDVLLCVVLGGVDLGAGVGTAFGAAYGALLVALINNGLRLLGVSSYGQNVINGLIIMAVVAFERYGVDKASGLVMNPRRVKKKERTA